MTSLKRLIIINNNRCLQSQSGYVMSCYLWWWRLWSDMRKRIRSAVTSAAACTHCKTSFLCEIIYSRINSSTMSWPERCKLIHQRYSYSAGASIWSPTQALQQSIRSTSCLILEWTLESVIMMMNTGVYSYTTSALQQSFSSTALITSSTVCRRMREYGESQLLVTAEDHPEQRKASYCCYTTIL